MFFQVIRGQRLLTFLSQMWRLFEGGAYSSKYGSQEYLASEKSVLASESNLSLATGLVG